VGINGYYPEAFPQVKLGIFALMQAYIEYQIRTHTARFHPVTTQQATAAKVSTIAAMPWGAAGKGILSTPRVGRILT